MHFAGSVFFFVCVCVSVCCVCFSFFMGPLWSCKTIFVNTSIIFNYEPYLTKHRLQHVCNKNWKSKGNSVETETHMTYIHLRRLEKTRQRKNTNFLEKLWLQTRTWFLVSFFVFLVSIFKQPMIPNFFCFLKYVLLQKMWNTKKYSSIVIVHTEGHDREGWHRNHDVSMVNNNDNFASLGVPGWRLHRLACKFSLTQWRY